MQHINCITAREDPDQSALEAGWSWATHFPRLHIVFGIKSLQYSHWIWIYLILQIWDITNKRNKWPLTPHLLFAYILWYIKIGKTGHTPCDIFFWLIKFLYSKIFILKITKLAFWLNLVLARSCLKFPIKGTGHVLLIKFCYANLDMVSQWPLIVKADQCYLSHLNIVLFFSTSSIWN